MGLEGWFFVAAAEGSRGRGTAPRVFAGCAAGVALCPKARVAYVTPSHQYPLGATMSTARRLQLLEWAHRSSAWIVEDDYDSEYRYESMPVASMQVAMNWTPDCFMRWISALISVVPNGRLVSWNG